MGILNNKVSRFFDREKKENRSERSGRRDWFPEAASLERQLKRMYSNRSADRKIHLLDRDSQNLSR